MVLAEIQKLHDQAVNTILSVQEAYDTFINKKIMPTVSLVNLIANRIFKAIPDILSIVCLLRFSSFRLISATYLYLRFQSICFTFEEGIIAHSDTKFVRSFEKIVTIISLNFAIFAVKSAVKLHLTTSILSLFASAISIISTEEISAFIFSLKAHL